MDFMDFYFYYVKVFLKALNPLCLKTTHSCGMCNCVYFCCWVSKNVYLATFPEAVNVRNIYLGLFFMYLSVPANDPLAQKKKKKKTAFNRILSVMGHVETHGGLPHFGRLQMLVPAQLWTCATRKKWKC